MKKVLLLIACISAIFCGYAQSTIDTALALQEGSNTYTNEGGTNVEVYYSYTAPAEQGKLVTVSSSNYYSFQCTLDGTYETNIQGIYYSENGQNGYRYPVKPGTTIYIKAYYSGGNTIDFNAEIVDAETDGGATCDDAIELGAVSTYIPSYYDSKTYSYNPTYAKYTATESGVLKIFLSGSVRTAKLMTSCDDANPTTLSTSYVSGKYEAMQQVEAGVTYIFYLELQSTPIFMSAEIVVLAPGETAQTAIEITAEGDYSGEIPNATANAANYIYYKYTAPAEESQLVTISRTSSSLSCSATLDGTYNTSVSGISTSAANLYETAFPVSAGQTIYFQLGGYNVTTAEFNISWEAANVDAGKTCEDPVILSEEKAFVPSNKSGYSTVPSYMSYTCEEDGLLEIYFTGSASNINVYTECGGSILGTFSTSYNNGTYVGKYEVEAGNTYIFAFSSYSPCYVWVALTHPVEGLSCDFPFDATESNTLPAEAGTYWYGYTTTGDGFLVIDSEDTFAGGTVSIWNSCTAYSADATVTGYMALRSRVYSNKTYYIKVEKAETTTEGETFSVTFEAEKPGDSEYNPYTVTSIEDALTLPKYNGTYWYKITAAQSGFLIADANDANINSSNTKVEIFNQGNTYTTLGSGQKYAKAEVTEGNTYLIKWTCNEGLNAFDFNIYYEEMVAGSTCSSAIEAIEGENTLGGASELYYSYTATQTGWLVIDTDITINVSFLRGCDSWSGTYTSVKEAMITKAELKEGEKCIIKFSNVEDETTFYLSMEDYAEGESCETAIAIEEGDTAIPATVGKYWYKYTAERNGMLIISSDMVYESVYDGYSTQNNEIRYLTDCTMYGTTIMKSENNGSSSTTIFKGQTIVNEGNVIYIQVKTVSAQEGKNLTLTLRDLQPGEGCTSPLEIEPGTFTLLSGATNSQPAWYGIQLEPGAFSVTSTQYFSMELYDSCDTSSPLASSTFDSSTYGYKLTYNIQTAGFYYLKQTSSYDNEVTVSGVYTGLDNVEANNNVRIEGNNIIVTADGTRTDVVICDITGKVLVAQAVYDNATFSVEKGIYIVKVADQVSKVAVR